MSQTSLAAYTAPATFEEFLQKWENKIRTVIRNYNFIGEDEDDIYQDMISEFWERDYLGAYDPTKSAFSTYLYAFLNVRMLGYCRTRKTVWQRTVDLEDAENLGDADRIEPDYASVMRSLRGLHVSGQKDMARLFKSLVVQVLFFGKKNQSELADEYGISPAAMTVQMQTLRRTLIELGFVSEDGNGNYEWNI